VRGGRARVPATSARKKTDDIRHKMNRNPGEKCLRESSFEGVSQRNKLTRSAQKVSKTVLSNFVLHFQEEVWRWKEEGIKAKTFGPKRQWGEIRVRQRDWGGKEGDGLCRSTHLWQEKKSGEWREGRKQISASKSKGREIDWKGIGGHKKGPFHFLNDAGNQPKKGFAEKDK